MNHTVLRPLYSHKPSQAKPNKTSVETRYQFIGSWFFPVVIYTDSQKASLRQNILSVGDFPEIWKKKA